MKTEISLKYEGPALADGQMDVYQTATNMVAFSEFLAVAVRATYGSSAVTRSEVVGFRQGSFTTMLALQVAGAAGAVFTELTPAQLWDVVKGAFSLWKHLKGSPPKSIENHGQMVTVENNSGQITQVRFESLIVVNSPSASESVKKFIGQPLKMAGIDLLVVGDQSAPVATVTESEAGYFVPVTATSEISDYTQRLALTVAGTVFEGGNKWRFTDGGGSIFAAAILDGDFMARVDKGFERFGKGDLLVADVRIVQSLTGQKVTMEREIVKVHQHVSPQEQPQLL